MKIYISGQITGLEQIEAYKKFEKAENELKARGSGEIVNPMKLNHEHDKSWENYMLVDIKALFNCNAIYMLNNWFYSKGSRIERSIAIEMDIIIIYEK